MRQILKEIEERILKIYDPFRPFDYVYAVLKKLFSTLLEDFDYLDFIWKKTSNNELFWLYWFTFHSCRNYYLMPFIKKD